MTSRIPFNYNFHPVGQGLFATGMIGCPNSTEPEDVLFNWVYDCGTSDSPQALKTEIRRHLHTLQNRRSIDCFIISHLDTDHIKGVAELMKHKYVKNLILPYVPFVDRLEIMLRSPSPSTADLNLAVDPSGYLQQLGGDNLGQIVYVMGSEGDDPVPPPETPEPPFLDPEGREGLWIDFEKVDKPPSDYNRGLRLTGTQLYDYFISSNTPISAGGLWEFVFYNEDYPEADQAFKDAVHQRVRQSHKPNKSFDAPDQLIADLKSLYDSKFKTALKRNNISLVTYSGPAKQHWIRNTRCSGAYPYASLPHHRLSPFLFRFPGPYAPPHNRTNPSILCFGDITLSQPRLNRIMNKMGRSRWDSLHPVQIAHHGARGSWFQDAALNFNHHDSVYSYGIHNTYQHPGKDVIDDFKTMSRTVLVNEHQGAIWFGNLTLR